jgi:dihydrofolate synthase / folylpolyglutamate synthase
MLSYSDTIEYLYNRLPVFQDKGADALRDGLGGIRLLMKHINNPENKLKTIHIAGTNGKGSSSHMLASILQEAGLKVGLYTSPHLVDFRERIRINGQMIPKEYVQTFTHDLKPFIEQNDFSFFEVTVALAFEYFVTEQVDIAIIEVGLGGEKDSTNIITPIISLITNISYDHVKILGDTLEEIAEAKAGIIKNNVPVVISTKQKSIENVFIEKAKKLNAPIYFADQIWQLNNQEITENHQITLLNVHSKIEKVLSCDLKGIYQSKNVIGVVQVIDWLQTNKVFTISEQVLKNGLENVQKNTGLQGRWQVLHTQPKVICDTGHNVGGITEVLHALQHETYNTLRIVIGFANDKDINEILTLLPKTAMYYFCKAKVFRGLPAQQLLSLANQYQLVGNAWDNVPEAYQQALGDAQKDDLLFVGGSNFVVGDLLEFLQKNSG